MIDDLKLYIKSLKGKIALSIAAISSGAIVMSSLSGCSADELDSVDDPSDVMMSEEPSEVVETSEDISEESFEIAKMPELPIKDEDGKIYTPDEITLEEVYAKIDEMVENSNFENDWKRDQAIATMLILNSQYMSKETFMTVKKDYLGNIQDMDLFSIYNYYFDPYVEDSNPITSFKYLFIDDKQSDAVEQICNYCNSNNYSENEFYDQVLNSILIYSSENKNYNPIFILEYSQLTYDSQYILYSELEKNNILEVFYPEDIITDDKGQTTIIKFCDGEYYTFEMRRGDYTNYRSSHKDKTLKLNN